MTKAVTDAEIETSFISSLAALVARRDAIEKELLQLKSSISILEQSLADIRRRAHQ